MTETPSLPGRAGGGTDRRASGSAPEPGGGGTDERGGGGTDAGGGELGRTPREDDHLVEGGVLGAPRGVESGARVGGGTNARRAIVKKW